MGVHWCSRNVHKRPVIVSNFLNIVVEGSYVFDIFLQSDFLCVMGVEFSISIAHVTLVYS